MLLYENLRPVFADVDEFLCLDPRSVADRITSRTRAVMFVGLGGNAGRLLDVAELCRIKKLDLILDAAHMAGSHVQGKHVGREAAVAVFSFQAVKNLPTADAGMVCFREGTLDAAARKWSWLGINKDTYTRTVEAAKAYKWRYEVEHPGFKYHGNSVMAALGLVALKYLDSDNVYRRQLASLYDEALREVPGVRTVPVAPGCTSSRHLYQVLAERRDDLMVYLNKESIFPGVHYRDNTDYAMYADASGTCPRAAEASGRIVSLPLHLRLTPSDVARVAKRLRAYYAGSAHAKEALRTP